MYSTAQFGKRYEVPVWQSSPMGPFDAWPSGGGGFETFYGFIGGENNQWDPALYDGTTPVEPPATAEEGYHLTEDLTDRAVGWMRQQKALMPDKPFFVYFAPRHTPRTTYRRSGPTGTRVSSTTAGTSSASAPLHGRRSWDHPRGRRADQSAHRDHGVGRHARAARRCWRGRWRCTPGSSSTRTITWAGWSTPWTTSVLDDTIIYYIIGDNGASAEGTMNGAFNELANFNGMAGLETPSSC